MKYFYSIILFLCIWASSIGQNPDPRLFTTWYLHYVEIDLGASYNVSEINPPINPTLVITNNLEFSGDGACNSFTGTYIEPFSGALLASEFNPTTTTCEEPIHNSFEQAYFTFLQIEYTYNFSIDQGGNIMTLSNPLLSFAVFKDYPPLSIPDFETSQIKIYPNPSNSIVNVTSNGIPITSIELLSLSGESIFIKNKEFDQINISSIKSGMYLIRIQLDDKYVIKTIIRE